MHALFITGGIGDTLALDGYLTPSERAKVSIVHLATRKHQPLSELVPLLYPQCKSVRVWPIKDDRWNFSTLKEFTQLTGQKLPALDWGIRRQFRKIREGQRQFTARPKLFSKLLSCLNHVVICPNSSDTRIQGRDFSYADWDLVLKWLAQEGLTGIVLTNTPCYVPQSKFLVNMTNELPVVAAIRAVRTAAAYIGIDSFLSVVAARALPSESIAIRSVNPHLYSWKSVYYAPHREFPFLGRSTDQLLARMANHAWTASLQTTPLVNSTAI